MVAVIRSLADLVLRPFELDLVQLAVFFLNNLFSQRGKPDSPQLDEFSALDISLLQRGRAAFPVYG